MFHEIISSSNQSSLALHTLDNGVLITAFELDILDEESLELEACEALIQNILNHFPEKFTLKIYFKSEFTNESLKDHSRSAAIEYLGSIRNRIFLILEKYPDLDLKLFSKKNKALSSQVYDFSGILDSGLKVRNLEQEEIRDIFGKMPEEIDHAFQTIDKGNELLSILRVVKQSEFGIELDSFSKYKDQLPVPYMICCSVQTVNQATAETVLRRRSKQNELGGDIKESRKFSEAQGDLEDVSLNGTKLFKFEWQLLLERNNEQALRADREEAKRKLQVFGEVYIESVGALNSLKSFYPGERPHYTLLEKDAVILCYLPLISRGQSLIRNLQKSSLVVHRKDESLSALNIFDPTYESFSWCIFGRPGTGKSVLTNAITRALIFDSNIKVIKIDVGGSHSRETEMLGGIEKTLNLNEPTGLNPFQVLEDLGPTKESVQILASFIEVLILEEGEAKLSKTMKSEIERAIQSYADAVSKDYCLQSFYDYSASLPRKDLLARWVGNGVYSNAFVLKPDSNLTNNQLTYFNFSKISQALDPDYAQGGLAAVMAQFNLEMLRKSEDKKRIVFIADETPFFIKKCFNFFNLSIANVRKEGHGFITVAQKSAHVVVDGDTGILDNSPNKVFFSLDGDDESFKARTQTTHMTVEKIKSLERKQGEFSEALLKDNKGERIIKIRLSPEEYWSYTSKDEDRQKLKEVMAACRSLTQEEIIRCLSLT